MTAAPLNSRVTQIGETLLQAPDKRFLIGIHASTLQPTSAAWRLPDANWSSSTCQKLPENLTLRPEFNAPALLDDFFDAEEKVPHVAKIDVEGHEAEVIRGMAGILQRGELRCIVLEMWRKERLGGTADDAATMLRASGFEPHVISRSPHGFDNVAWIR